MNPHLRYAQAIHGVLNRARHRHHRHDPPGRSRAGDRSARAGARPVAGDRRRRALVRRLPPVDDDAPVRHRRAGREEQPRHVLGDAGAAFARLTGNEEQLASAASASRRSCAADGRRRQLPAGDGPHQALRLLALQPRGDGHDRPDPLDAAETTSGASSCRTGAACAARWRSWSVHPRPEGWPKPPDVMYDDQWPMRQASLLFAGLAFGEPSYLELWKTLPADSTVEEVVRNFFVRQPVLWVATVTRGAGYDGRRGMSSPARPAPSAGPMRPGSRQGPTACSARRR